MSASQVWRRRAVAVGLLVAALVAGYYLWLRDASVFAIEEVEVEGASTDAERIAAAVEAAAEGMTTLHVDDEKLRAAVSQFPTVASVSADATLLDKLTVTVTERLPVAQIELGGEPVAVSADGYVLPRLEGDHGELPPIEAGEKGGRLDPVGVAQAAIIGAAPEQVREAIESANWSQERGGVVVILEGAPELRFGSGREAERKWKAVAAVLTDPERGSPAYVDVSVPERTVSGG